MLCAAVLGCGYLDYEYLPGAEERADTDAETDVVVTEAPAEPAATSSETPTVTPGVPEVPLADFLANARILSPQSLAAQTAGTTVSLRGEATANLPIAAVQVNGQPANWDAATGLWDITVALVGGINSFEVFALDDEGRGNDVPLVTSSIEQDALWASGVTNINIASLSADGRTLYVSSFGGTFSNLDAHSGATLGSVSGSHDPGTNLRYAAFDTAGARTLHAHTTRIRAVDVATGAASILSGSGNGVGTELVTARELQVDAANGRVVVADFAQDALFAVDLATGNRTLLSGPAIGIEPARGSGPDLIEVRGLALNPAGTTAYASFEDGSNEGIMVVDLATGARSVLSDGSTGTGPALRSGLRSLVYDGANTRLIVAEAHFDGATDRWDARLLAVSLSTGDRIRLADASVGTGPLTEPIAFVGFRDDGALLLHDRFEGLVAVDLGSGDRTLVRGELSVGEGPRLDNLEGIALDHAGGRLLVGDAGRRELISIDLSTGDRSVLTGGVVGTGPTLNLTEDVVVDASGEVIIVSARNDTLTRVDPTTGDRTLLSGSGAGSGPALSSPQGMWLSPAGDRLMLLDSNLEMLLEIDLSTGDRTELSGPGRGAGPAFNTATYFDVDSSQSIAWASDDGLREVVRVDLATGDRSILVLSGQRPTRFDGVALSDDDTTLMAIDYSTDALYAIEVATGASSLVSGSARGQGPLFDFPDFVAVDFAAGAAWVLSSPNNVASSVIEVDLTTGDRFLVSR